MGLILGLALAVFYGAGYQNGPVTGFISNFLEFKWATAAVSAVIWALLLAAGRLPMVPIRLTWVDAAIAGLVLWALVSLTWTPDMASAGLSGLFAGIALVFYLLARATAPEAVLRILVMTALVVMTGSLVAGLVMAMIEFPGQNAASALQAILFLALVAPASAAPARDMAVPALRPLAVGAAAVAILLAWPVFMQVQAQNRFAAADLLHKAGQLAPSADAMTVALATSDITPKLRLRLYPQSIVAGVPYWTQTGIPELERRYSLSASAAPRHPVLLDLRLKFLLALTNPPATEVEAALAALKANSGLSNANAHVLDAAWALRTGDRVRARSSLALAQARLAANPTAVSAPNNRSNVDALLRQLGTP